MKKLLCIAASILFIPAGSALALVGGPWDHDSFQHNQESGIYQGVATFVDGSGIFRFGVSNDSLTLPSLGLSVWWFRGITYQGNCQGMVDIPARIVVGINTAFSTQLGSIQNSGRNRERLTANWMADIYTQIPQVRFSGSGTFAVFGDLDEEDTDFDRTFVTGPVTDENGDFLFIIDTNTSEIDGFGGESDDFPEVGFQGRIQVFGSQVSTLDPANN